MADVRTDKRTVLFVSHSANLYGAERSLLTLVRNLRKKGVVEPVVLLPAEGPLTDLLRNSGVRVFVHHYYGWLNQRRSLVKVIARIVLNLVALARLFRELKLVRPDLVYSNSLASPFGAMIAFALRVPHVWHAREFVHEDMNADYDLGTHISMLLVDKGSSKIVCNSRAIRKKLISAVDESKLEIVYNGFEFKESKITAMKKYEQCVVDNRWPIHLTMIGSLQPGKGQDDAIRALSILVNRGEAVRLSIAGTGLPGYLAELKLLIKRLSLTESVTWHGFVEDTPALLDDTAVVLVCSRSEAFGRVAVESMAALTPVIGADSGGVPEIIEDGVTGLLYRPGDPEDLADGVERLTKNRELYEGVVERARSLVISKFSAEQYVLGVQRVIESACET